MESEASLSQNEHLPALIITIRGSAKVVDHMVNLNGRPIPVNDFLVSFILLIPELKQSLTYILAYRELVFPLQR